MDGIQMHLKTKINTQALWSRPLSPTRGWRQVNPKITQVNPKILYEKNAVNKTNIIGLNLVDLRMMKRLGKITHSQNTPCRSTIRSLSKSSFKYLLT
jgi:hypothetical protein